MDKIEALNNELVEIAHEICRIREQVKVDKYFLLPEYQRLQECGLEPIRLTKEYIEAFQNIHGIELPSILKKISTVYGEHSLSHYLFASQANQKFIPPKYIIEDRLWGAFIKKGIDPIKLELFKDDYSDYFDPKSNRFKSEEMQKVYESLNEDSDANFTKILDTGQQVEILLNTKHRGYLVSTYVGDKLHLIDGKEIYQPYYSVSNHDESVFEKMYIDYLNENITRLKEKINGGTVNKFLDNS